MGRRNAKLDGLGQARFKKGDLVRVKLQWSKSFGLNWSHDVYSITHVIAGSAPDAPLRRHAQYKLAACTNQQHEEGTIGDDDNSGSDDANEGEEDGGGDDIDNDDDDGDDDDDDNGGGGDSDEDNDNDDVDDSNIVSSGILACGMCPEQKTTFSTHCPTRTLIKS